MRSIYGLGSKSPENPGLSFEDNTEHPTLNVFYYGETENTHFGQVMFEADMLLKTMAVSEDFINKYVPSFEDDFEIHARSWFSPKLIILNESLDMGTIAFDKIEMQVLTETRERKHPAGEHFAKYMTENYDALAQEHSCLLELKNLAVITAVVKWIHDNHFPFDLSPFRNYTPKYVETPKTINTLEIMVNPIKIRGGVIYKFNETNYFVEKSPELDTFENAVLDSHSNDAVLSWNIGDGLTAVLGYSAPAARSEEINKTFVDLSFPNYGNIPLFLIRTYSTLSSSEIPPEKKWDTTPAKLLFPKPLETYYFSDDEETQFYPEMIVRIGQAESVYLLQGINKKNQAIYKRDSSSQEFLVREDDGKYLLVFQDESLLFNHLGRLVQAEDFNGYKVQYQYENDLLTSISDEFERSISLEYTDSFLTSAFSSAGKVIWYDYDSKGNLLAVKDEEGVLSSYEYDEKNRLTAIFNAKGNKVFEANYDCQNRVQETLIGGQTLSQVFNLYHSHSYSEQLDPKYRPEKVTASLRRWVQSIYAEANQLKKTTTTSDQEITYEYNSLGRLIKVSDPFHGERAFTYDTYGNIISMTNGMRLKTNYQYNEQGKLIAIYPSIFNSTVHIVIKEKGEISYEGIWQVIEKEGGGISCIPKPEVDP